MSLALNCEIDVLLYNVCDEYAILHIHWYEMLEYILGVIISFQTPLQEACQIGDSADEIIRALLKHGADVNTADESGTVSP